MVERFVEIIVLVVQGYVCFVVVDHDYEEAFVDFILGDLVSKVPTLDLVQGIVVEPLLVFQEIIRDTLIGSGVHTVPKHVRQINKTHVDYNEMVVVILDGEVVGFIPEDSIVNLVVINFTKVTAEIRGNPMLSTIKKADLVLVTNFKIVQVGHVRRFLGGYLVGDSKEDIGKALYYCLEQTNGVFIVILVSSHTEDDELVIIVGLDVHVVIGCLVLI